MQHEASKGQEREPRHCFWQPLIVTRQAAKARQPGETALDDPAAWQQNKATLGFLATRSPIRLITQEPATQRDD